MGSISTGVGLFSGIDIASTVEQLIAIDARPRDQLAARVETLTAERGALAELSGRISALLSRFSALSSRSIFQGVRTSSSDSNILSATAQAGTPTGSYRFSVQSLASTQQLVSSGFRSRDSTLSSGTFSIESAQARVQQATRLSELNAGQGIPTGRFELIDRSGASAEISTSGALTLSEVVERINDADVAVRARIQSDRIVLEDTSGGVGTFRVREVNGGRTAEALGFGSDNDSALSDTLTGERLIRLGDETALGTLNDGRGLGTNGGAADFSVDLGAQFGNVNIFLSDNLQFGTPLDRLNRGAGVDLGTVRVQTRDGFSRDIDLSGAESIQDVVDALNEQTTFRAGEVDDERLVGTPRVSVVVNGSRLVLTDNTEPLDEDDPDRFSFSITDIDGGRTARDLGLDVAASGEGNRVDGRDILQIETLGDVVAAINFAVGNQDENGNRLFEARIADDGQRIEFDVLAPVGQFTLSALDGSTALTDLGLSEGTVYGGIDVLSGRRIIGGVNSVLLDSLNGGQGIETGLLEFEAAGQLVQVDASSAETLSDVVDLINFSLEDLGYEATYDRTGTKLQINNLRDDDAPLTIRDVSGSFAETVGIAGTAASVTGSDLERQYVARSTLLDELNNGRGVGEGTIRVTNSAGQIVDIELRGRDIQTVGDVIDAINDDAVGFEARLNATGDGISLVDTAGGDLALTVSDQEGSIGSDLNLTRDAVDGVIDGTFEFQYSVGANETLNDVFDRINRDNSLAEASIINDGTGTSPFRLSVNSRVSGLAGELIIDAGTTGLDFSTLARAQDAALVLGDDSDSGLLVTSSSNTFENVIDGLTVTASDVTTAPQTITVDEELATLTEALQGFVSDYNDAIARIDELSSFDLETETAGILLGDSAVSTAESRLFRLVGGGFYQGSASFSRLSDLGIEVEAGGQLSFNESEFNEVFEANREDVIRFFTEEETGFANAARELVEDITEADGLLDRRSDGIESQQELLTDRISALDEILEARRQRLTRQFVSMEQTLAGLSSQSSALASISPLSVPTSTGGI